MPTDFCPRVLASSGGASHRAVAVWPLALLPVAALLSLRHVHLLGTLPGASDLAKSLSTTGLATTRAYFGKTMTGVASAHITMSCTQMVSLIR